MGDPSFLTWLFGAWGCKDCNKMHRRAQAAESDTARMKAALVAVLSSVGEANLPYEVRMRLAMALDVPVAKGLRPTSGPTKETP